MRWRWLSFWGIIVAKHMDKQPTQFDFWYAVNNTEVVLAPRRHLETFGNTLINYHMVSELMDNVGQVRVREGRMQALRPQIVTPSAYSSMILEGFGEQAEKYLDGREYDLNRITAEINAQLGVAALAPSKIR